MKLFKCIVSEAEVSSDAYPGAYPDAAEAGEMKDFFYCIEQDEMRMNGDNELIEISAFNDMSDEMKEEYDQTSYAIASVYGYEEVPMKSLKTFVMKQKKYMQKVMKKLPAGKHPMKAAIKKYAKLLGKKAADALKEGSFLGDLNADMDNIVCYTTNTAQLLGNKDDEGKVEEGSDNNVPIIIAHIQSDDWTKEKGTPAKFYIWSPCLVAEAC